MYLHNNILTDVAILAVFVGVIAAVISCISDDELFTKMEFYLYEITFIVKALFRDLCVYIYMNVFYEASLQQACLIGVVFCTFAHCIRCDWYTYLGLALPSMKPAIYFVYSLVLIAALDELRKLCATEDTLGAIV